MNILKSSFLFLLSLSVFSCGNSKQKTSDNPSVPYMEQINKSMLTELPESHFLPSQIEDVEINLETIFGNKVYHANNMRNKVYTYYRHAFDNLIHGGNLTIHDLAWVVLPKLNIKDREFLVDFYKEDQSKELIQIYIPQKNASNIRDIEYTVKIQTLDGEITSVKKYSKNKIAFEISQDDFQNIFINEKSNAFIAVNEITYLNNERSWNTQRQDRATKTSLNFTLTPQSIFYNDLDTDILTYMASLYSPTFILSNHHEINTSELAKMSIRLPNNDIKLETAKKVEISSEGNIILKDLKNNHLYLKIGFKRKKYRIKNNTQIVSVFSHQEKNYDEDYDDIYKSCTYYWPSLEEISSNSLTEEELKKLLSAIKIKDENNMEMLFKKDSDFYISNLRQKVFIDTKVNKKVESLNLFFESPFEVAKETLNISKPNCNMPENVGPSFTLHEPKDYKEVKEKIRMGKAVVNLEEYIPFVEYTQVYR